MATKAKLQKPAVLKDSEAPYGKKQKTNAAFKTDRGPAYIYRERERWLYGTSQHFKGP